MDVEKRKAAIAAFFSVRLHNSGTTIRHPPITHQALSATRDPPVTR
jgi:hypothetical protein